MAPATSAFTGASLTSEAAFETYTTGLKNAHALEQQAMQLMQRQLERYEHYPEVSQRLRQHIGETEQQIARLDDLLHKLGTDRSVLKGLGDLDHGQSGGNRTLDHARRDPQEPLWQPCI